MASEYNTSTQTGSGFDVFEPSVVEKSRVTAVDFFATKIMRNARKKTCRRICLCFICPACVKRCSGEESRRFHVCTKRQRKNNTRVGIILSTFTMDLRRVNAKKKISKLFMNKYFAIKGKDFLVYICQKPKKRGGERKAKRPTFALGLKAGPFFICPTTPCLKAGKGESVLAFVGNDGIVRGRSVNGFPVGGMFGRRALDRCNDSRNKTKTTKHHLL